MAESYVQIPPDSTGKRLRSVTHTVGGAEVHSHTSVLLNATTGDPLNPSTEATLHAVWVRLGSIQSHVNRGLAERMMARAPHAGTTLWLDTEDPDYIYIMEAPEGLPPGEIGFAGIRIPLTASGGLLGPVEINDELITLTWDNRKTDGGWRF